MPGVLEVGVLPQALSHGFRGCQEGDVAELGLEEFFGLLGVEGGRVVFECSSVVDIIDTQDPRDIMLNDIKDLLHDTLRLPSLLQNLPNQLLLQHKTRIQQRLIVVQEGLLDTVPHVVGLLFTVVAVQDVPALHESAVLRQ